MGAYVKTYVNEVPSAPTPIGIDQDGNIKFEIRENDLSHIYIMIAEPNNFNKDANFMFKSQLINLNNNGDEFSVVEQEDMVIIPARRKMVFQDIPYVGFGEEYENIRFTIYGYFGQSPELTVEEEELNQEIETKEEEENETELFE